MVDDELTGFDAWFGSKDWKPRPFDGAIAALSVLDAVIADHISRQISEIARQLDSEIMGDKDDDNGL